MATAVTMTDSVVVRLEKAAILCVIRQEPAFAELFIAHLLGRTIRAESDLVDQLFNSSEKRLARLLLLLANFGKEDKPEPMIAKISQEMLADMIGTTRSRVSFFMNKFRKLGFIDYNGGIQVHSSLLNLVLHEEPHIETYVCHFSSGRERSLISADSRDEITDDTSAISNDGAGSPPLHTPKKRGPLLLVPECGRA